MGSVLPEEIEEKLCHTEEEYFKKHSAALKSYMSKMLVDLTVVTSPLLPSLPFSHTCAHMYIHDIYMYIRAHTHTHTHIRVSTNFNYTYIKECSEDVLSRISPCSLITTKVELFINL